MLVGSLFAPSISGEDNLCYFLAGLWAPAKVSDLRSGKNVAMSDYCVLYTASLKWACLPLTMSQKTLFGHIVLRDR